MTLVPARRRGTALSPDNPEIVAPLLDSDVIFLGPGSPSYAVRQLQDSLAWHTLRGRQRLGAAVVLASAASIAAGAYALPVYEIYKVGEDPHWKPGLDLFADFGLKLAVMPHWNNNDGGAELDTSRCFMGLARFEPLLAMLPADVVVLGRGRADGIGHGLGGWYRPRAGPGQCDGAARGRRPGLRPRPELSPGRVGAVSLAGAGGWHSCGGLAAGDGRRCG